jgi:hypothetical protein
LAKEPTGILAALSIILIVQYKLKINEDVTEFYVFLSQLPEAHVENSFIGFYVIYTPQVSSYKLLDIENTDIIVQEQKWRSQSEGIFFVDIDFCIY